MSIPAAALLAAELRAAKVGRLSRVGLDRSEGVAHPTHIK